MMEKNLEKTINTLITRWVIISILILGAPVSLMSQEMKKVFSIQVFSSRELARAEKFADTLRDKGYTPVSVFEKGDLQAVTIGEFTTHADAVYYRKKFRESNFKDAFIVSREVENTTIITPLNYQEFKTSEMFSGVIRSKEMEDVRGKKIKEILEGEDRNITKVPESIMNASNDSLPEKDLLKKAYALGRKNELSSAIQAHRDFLRRFPNSPKAPDSMLSIGYLIKKRGSEDEAISTFETIIDLYPDKKQAGEAMLRVAYLKSLKSRKAPDKFTRDAIREESLFLFETIARGKIPSTEMIRIEAMLRCAKLYHARKERLRALQAYREIASIVEADGLFDPSIHKSMAGLYMELARSGVGSLDDCIKECDIILGVEDATNFQRAIALQMKAEAFYYKKEYNKAISLENKVLTNYADERKAAMGAQFFLGLIYLERNEYQEATVNFQRVIDNFTDSDNMGKNNLRADSVLYQARCYLKLKQPEKAKERLNTLAREFPGSQACKQGKELLAKLR